MYVWKFECNIQEHIDWLWLTAVVHIWLLNSVLFQDEIDCLQKEVEELRSKNLSLESQIKTILDPLTLVQGNQNEDKHPAADNQSKADPETVVEWKKKLRTANEIYEKVKDDVDKLKEVSCSCAKVYGGGFWSSTIFCVFSQV